MWLTTHAPDMTREELTYEFNRIFNCDKKVEAIRCLGKRYKWPYKRAKHWAEGLSREEFKSHFTDAAMRKRTAHFTDKNEERRCKVGDIIIRHDVPYIVINDERGHLDKRIKRYDRYVWEMERGALPDGYMLVHIDGDEFNNNIDNLYPLPVAQIQLFGRWLLSDEGKKDKILRKTALMYCELKRRVNE